MKLNVGCGDFRADGWVNVDVIENDEVKPDLVCSLQNLYSYVADVEQVYFGHVLEHVDRDDVIISLRNFWKSCVPGCKIAIVGPDALRAWNGVINGTVTRHEALGATLGACRWSGDEHRWVCYEDELMRLVKTSGLSDVRSVPISSSALNSFPVVSRAGWQCALVGMIL